MVIWVHAAADTNPSIVSSLEICGDFNSHLADAASVDFSSP